MMNKKYLVGLNILVEKEMATLDLAKAMKECLKKHYKIGYLKVEDGICVEIKCLIKGIKVDSNSEGDDDICKNIQAHAAEILTEAGIKPQSICSIIYDNTTDMAKTYIDFLEYKLWKLEKDIIMFDL